MSQKIKTYDFLVIGSGIAGLNFALQASRYGTVAIVTKKELMESNSNYAQGGIAAVLDARDSFEHHVNDTLVAGCFLNDQKAVAIMVRQAPQEIRRLIALGVGFNREENRLCLTQEGGHSARRIAHVQDATGKEIERALIHNIRKHKKIETCESHAAFDLILTKGACRGALVFDEETQTIIPFFAKATILATGGAGQAYERNCNPKIATGDGIAIAARAGAAIQDMEFMQFHPTALAKKGKPAFLISETVRGEGGILLNAKRKPFMKRYHPKKELAPRDIVSRAIFTELKHGPVFLDIRHKGSRYIKKRFPYIYNQLWWFGIRMDKDLIPIAPAAHYTCGGIHTTAEGETSIPGLFAFGEVAHTGVHGANRLASNSLLECMVFSSRALSSAKKYLRHQTPACLGEAGYESRIKKIPIRKKMTPATNKKITAYKKNIQTLMWKHVGIVRQEKKMKQTLQKLKKMEPAIEELFRTGITADMLELRSLHTVASLITAAALQRKESVGCHFVDNYAYSRN
ncbi:MAG TPA: L-aspartate oxidase [Candidatus Magasanikbacteria bacterium]|nr:MAG: L-aspartate oxidase [Candidatus Magasanikbacteria bacterium RIFCSPLOWO2_02_FULL_47_16]OGH80170.1 MAG: L-aspartate oxidase [Candidatus Magasanikbacteria bacterium RIFCSPHIGHO2_02_FULL_48_18]OGH82844.1 MAG: L-aspartate oxidase [Candidatus Magasanikbacteria bacterium RIFCSPLOWO2_12_FULL_47_9b]HAZ28366.1 L-aspartate oxidase [Candidatus Magasanikbacteria bacterium]